MKKYLFFLFVSTVLSKSVLAEDIAPLFEKLNPSVVTIQTIQLKILNDTETPTQALGSGVIIDKSGLILTAAHVVDTANTIGVKLHDDSVIEADIVKSVPSADIALLRLKEVPENLKVAKLGDSGELKVGNQIFVIGSPFGVEHSLSVGHLSGTMERGLLANGAMVGYLQTDAAINQGNSGGPMFNLNGEVVGIVSFILSKSGGFNGIGFAVDINTTKSVLLDNGAHFWTGFDGLFLGEKLSRILNVPQKNGVLVQRVTSNSFAEQIGLVGGFFQAEILGENLWLGGDIILSIQGETCDSPHNLSNIKNTIDNLRVGDEVTMKILRYGVVLNLKRRVVSKDI